MYSRAARRQADAPEGMVVGAGVSVGFAVTARGEVTEDNTAVDVAAGVAKSNRLVMRSMISSRCSPNSSRTGDSDSGAPGTISGSPAGFVKPPPSLPGASPGSLVPLAGSLVSGLTISGSSGLGKMISPAARIGKTI